VETPKINEHRSVRSAVNRNLPTSAVWAVGRFFLLRPTAYALMGMGGTSGGAVVRSVKRKSKMYDMLATPSITKPSSNARDRRRKNDARMTLPLITSTRSNSGNASG